MTYQKLTIHLKDRSYPIFVGQKILKDLGQIIRMHLPSATQVLVVTNTTVEKLYANQVVHSLESAGLEPQMAVIPDGEEFKTLEQAVSLYDKLIEHRFDRSSVVIGLGGGVVGDLAGFVAATYMRGVGFVQVPTTVLAQIDSSIGGKVAVNHPEGKNLIGAFYQPKLVLADTVTLQSLSKAEFSTGMAEVVKHGMILDAGYFQWIEENVDLILAREQDVLTKLVYGSCVIKGKVVEADETEQNLRLMLNFGHTVGHALEALTHYTRYGHGQAVAIGMVAASRFAQSLGMIGEKEVLRLIDLLKKLELPTRLPADVSPVEIIQGLARDKKAYHGKVKIILPTAIGKVEIVDNWEVAQLAKVLEECYI